MKKIIILIIVISLWIFLISCSSNKSSVEPNIGENQSSVVDRALDDNGELEEIQEEMTFTELVLHEDEDCFVKVTDIEEDGLGGYILRIILENKSDHKNYIYKIEDISVDGVEIQALLLVEVVAGEIVNEDIYLEIEEFKDNNPPKFSDIQMKLLYYEIIAEKAPKEINEKLVRIYPYGEENSVKYIRETRDTDKVIIDNDMVTVIITGYEEGPMWYYINTYVINKTDKTLQIGLEDTFINGYKIDVSGVNLLKAGNCEFSSITILNDQLIGHNIENVNEVNGALTISEVHSLELNNFRVDEIYRGDITINP